MKENIEILFQDENIIALDKPSGLESLSEKDTRLRGKKTLQNIVEKQIGQKLLAFHTLDKDASGVLIFAKNENALSSIRKEFKNKNVIRTYILLLSGVVEKDEDIIEEPILVSERDIAIDPYGEKASTKYKILEKFRGYTLVEACPLTQIKHQIRLHFWNLGNPLAIDPLYASGDPIFLSSFKRNYKMKTDGLEKPLISRLTMHCSEIKLNLQNE
ncbi:MAG: RNA pseudouridine synthase, partial [Elusimicrobiota bacterium]|nr:RNA pseudouridine synthase [Elusimicrobiota bacterium]